MNNIENRVAYEAEGAMNFIRHYGLTNAERFISPTSTERAYDFTATTRNGKTIRVKCNRRWDWVDTMPRYHNTRENNLAFSKDLAYDLFVTVSNDGKRALVLHASAYREANEGEYSGYKYVDVTPDMVKVIA